MVQTIRIEAEARGRAGKGAARATRREGLVPGVVYGAKREATLVAFDPRDIMKELHKGSWQSHVYDVVVKDGPTERALLREVQFHPVTDRPIHIDFQRLAPGARIRIKVPVVFKHEDSCPGLKAGGVLNLVRRELEVLVDPEAVPETFTIDLAEAKIGDSIRWSAVVDKADAKPVITGRDFVVATIAPPTVVEEVAAPVAAAEPAKKGGKAAAKPAAKAPAAAAPAPAKKK